MDLLTPLWKYWQKYHSGMTDKDCQFLLSSIPHKDTFLRGYMMKDIFEV